MSAPVRSQRRPNSSVRAGVTRFFEGILKRLEMTTFVPNEFVLEGDNRLSAGRVISSKTVRTERQKMFAGEVYNPLDPELVAARERARDLCQQLNATREDEAAGRRRRILRDLFRKGGDTVSMQPPFFCDYATNIELGERVSSTSTASCWTFAASGSAISPSSSGSADLHATASL